MAAHHQVGEEQAQPAVAPAHPLSVQSVHGGTSQREPRADRRVVVEKAKRTLSLYCGHRLLKSYPVALGRRPLGPKRHAGDLRTPEGRYTLDWRNPDSMFFRSIHISYPNARDRRHALAMGRDPGGEIMIHGAPQDLAEQARLLGNGADWTAGCIAVDNEDMQEIWEAVEDGTSIEILP